MKDRLIVIASFLMIFAFSAVDCSISPLVEVLGSHFSVQPDKILWLISSGTLGIVLGVFIGPRLTAAFRVSRIALVCTLGMVVSLGAFLLVNNFNQALAVRFLFGLCSGVLASLVWWTTYYGVIPEFYQAMVIVLSSGRPLAVALGVPMAGYLVKDGHWQLPFWIFTGIGLVAGIILFFFLGREEGTKERFSLQGLLAEYREALKIPHSLMFYLGFIINRICYFGVYSMIGLWFMQHYRLSHKEIASILFFVGVGEALVNFVIPTLIKAITYRRVFIGSIIASLVVLGIFIWGLLPLTITICLLTLFVSLDRIYCMAIVITIPDMFPAARNKTVFGSMNTLTAWMGLTLISWFEGKYTETLGLPVIQWVLIVCFIIGILMIYQVQSRTALKTTEKAA